MARFPHIGGSTDGKAYPYMKNVKPYRRDVTFDYTRYDYPVEVKLCSVPWPIDYRHTVAWEDAAARDAYFDSLDGYTQEVKALELMQGFARVQLDSIRLDLPYDEALTYNYLYTRVPMLTKDDPIRNEGETGIRTICAFIQDCVYLSPSTTEIVLSVDMWTTYLPHLSVAALMLQRGHAPMYRTTADTYLSDPVNHSSDLLTPDVNYGENASVTRYGEIKPLSTAEPMYVVATTIPYAAFTSMPQASTTSATPPTFSNIANKRDGYQVNVGGYAWNTYGNNGLYNASVPAACVDGSTPTGIYYYGIYASAISSGALRAILEKYPLLGKACEALYVVPSDLVTKGTAHTVGTYTIYEIRSNPSMQALSPFTLSKAMFNYPSRYRDIAKLYTAPYAAIELSDDMGNVIPLSIENCHSTIAVSQHLDMAFPFLSWEAMVTNYASVATQNANYNWVRYADGLTEGRSLPNADFAEVALEFGIDTYQLRMESWPIAQLDSYFDADMERERAIVAYQSTIRSANTVKENANDSNATANTNALASNSTANTNALESNATANTNALNMNTLAKENEDRSAKCASDNAEVDWETIDAIAIEDDALAYGNYGNSKFYLDGDIAQDGMIVHTKDYQTAVFNAGMQQTALGGLMGVAGNIATGNPYGAVSSALSALVTATGEGGVHAAADTYYDWQTTFQKLLNAANTSTQGSYISAVSGLRHSQVYDIADNNKTCANQNTNNKKNRTDANANLTKTTADTNANRTKTTADANANRTKSTSDDNAGYSRGTTEENAKAALYLAQDAYTARIEGAGLQNPTAMGSVTGDGKATGYRARGLHLRAKTQSDSAIARAGDTFLRYGYAFDGIWTVESWCPTGHDFCYWQAIDVWMSASDVANSQVERALESILSQGVTVWADPEKIGRVAI